MHIGRHGLDRTLLAKSLILSCCQAGPEPK